MIRRHRARAGAGWRLVVLIGMGLAGCAREPSPGAYAFRALELLRDDCGQVPTPEALWDGRLRAAGEVLWLDYDLFEMELRGQYREVEDSFFLHGSAQNVTGEVAGEACLFEWVTVHLDGKSEGPSAFTGTVEVEYESRAEPACVCRVSARFRADRTGG
jgi:hypothetical protein